MFTDLIQYPIESDRLRWESRLVVRDLFGKPHLFQRLKLTGTRFPSRALEPFVSVGRLRSRFVELAADSMAAYAYFDEPLSLGSRIEFGYGRQAYLRFPQPLELETTQLLKRNLLPQETINLDRFFGSGPD